MTRQRDFIDLVRQAAKENSRIWTPGERASRNWPLCLICGRDVEAAEMMNWNARSVDIVVKCHGQEDSVKVRFPFRIDNDDPLADDRANTHIRRAMGDFCAFDPTVPKK